MAVSSCFAAPAAVANPTGANVVRGTAAIHQAGNLLQITNSPNAIINWQSFSIGANEITRFIQQSNSSAVLNRVVGQDPSRILGTLQSRLSDGVTRGGHVVLINPNGISFEKGSRIDLGGLIASTLQLSDADFLAGRLRFTDGLGKGVINEGNITTGAGGSVYLVGSSVSNGGIITSPGGEVVLAAGNSVELVNPGTPNLRVEVEASDHEARNLGQIMSDAGRVGIYAGLINHSGTIRANSAVSEGGRIVLKAAKDATLEAGSVTAANGTKGGSITVESGGTTLVAGTVNARGSHGRGGTVSFLGHQVGVIGNALINASGAAGGGTVLVGGDFQGKNPEVQNAFRTYLGPDASIRADAIESGDGGKVIVWADDATRAYGTISARGGAQSGNGGFVEVSGGWLDFKAGVDTRAPNGTSGSLLLDPTNIWIAASLTTATAAGMIGTDTVVDNQQSFFAATNPVSDSLLTTSMLEQALAGSGFVTVSSFNSAGTGQGNITVVDSVGWGSTATLNLSAESNIDLRAALNGPNGRLFLSAGDNITQTSSGAINTSELYANAQNGNVLLNMANNKVGLITGHAQNVFRFKNAQSLEIGTINSAESSGISTSGNCCDPQVVDVTVTSGNLTVTENVSANGNLSTGVVALKANGGNINVSGASVTADGAEGAAVNLIASGNVSVTGATLQANADNTCCFGGSAGVGIAAGGNIVIDGSEGYAFAGGGTSVGGSAAITLAANGGISILSATLDAAGGEGSTRGGDAAVTLMANGGALLIRDSANTVAAFGGESFNTGGNAAVSITANGDITLDASRVMALGYADPNCDCTTPNVGGNGIVSLNPMSGTVQLLNGATVEAAGGNGITTNGSGLISMIFAGRSTGGYFIDGTEGLIVDDPLRPSSGFFVNGSPGILGASLIVTYSNDVLFVDPLVAAMNQQVDVLADQLKAGDTGEGGEDKDKKKLPFCDG